MGKKVRNLTSAQGEDEALLRSFLAKDMKSFDKLVLKYRDLVFNLCYRMLGDYDMANDCAQETFIRIYNKAFTFKFKSNFSTWMYRIAVNICKNHISSKAYRMRNKMVRIDCNHGRDDIKIEVGDDTNNPSEIFEKDEQSRAVQDAIDSLPGDQKALVVLRDIEGKSYDEIAGITGLKQGTVKSKLSRARDVLRQKLRSEIYNEVR